MKRLTVLLSVTLLLGCSGFQTEQQFETIKNLQSVDNDVPLHSAKPACEVDYADYELSGKLMAFEISDKTNLSLGFNLFSGLLKAVGVSLKTERGRMLMSMQLQEPRHPTEMVADVTGEGKSSGIDFNINLDLIKLGAEFGYYYQTPVSKLTEKTLSDSLKRLTTELSAVETTWKTRVVNSPSRHEVIIPAGSVAGVRVGDTFKISNVRYLWEGVACQSQLLLDTPIDRLKPTARGRVVQVEKNAALLELSEMDDDAIIDLGARVEADVLPLAKKEKSRSLFRSVRVTGITSGILEIENGSKVDLSGYVNEQVTALFNSYGFYERK